MLTFHYNYFWITLFFYFIYIYIYLLIYYLPAFTVTKKKKKKKFQNSEITIYLESLPGKKMEKGLSGEKKEKANLVIPIEKKSRDMQSVGQNNKNPPQNAAMLQLQRVLNTR